ncbi:MAG TPA: SRPBCC family protein [Streptosporangiaceae bacterium]
MATYEATIPSTWPADETFGYLATFSNAAHWDPGVRSGAALDAGEVRTGSRFRLVVSFLGRGLPLTYQVVSYSAEGRYVLLDAASLLLRARDLISVRPVPPADGPAGSRSVVGYRADVTMRGPLRLLEPLLSRGFAAVGDHAVAGLARVLATPAGSAAQAS